jgi:pyruvate dehydrogenase E1 component alpha subunit
VGDPQRYKTKEEMESYKARDPLEVFKKRVVEKGMISEAELAKIDVRATEAVEEAVRFAEESPFPVPEECLRDVYVSYPAEGGDL